MNLDERIATYTPPKAARQIISSTKIALLVGISGAGKDTIKRGLLKKPGFGEIVSHTTRPPRSNEGVLEEDGVDYHFIDEDTAHAMLDRGEFVEAKYVHGTVYGTSINEVRRAGESGTAITDVDVQGVAEYKGVSDQVVAIFVIPPNYEEWIRRLKRRYTTDEEFLREWPKRRDSAVKEYYHCVVNDDLDRAIEVAADIAARPDVFTRKDDEARIAARDLLNQIEL